MGLWGERRVTGASTWNLTLTQTLSAKKKARRKILPGKIDGRVDSG